MSNENEQQLATRLIRYFREGRVTESELLNKLSDFIFEPYWPEIAGMLSADELQRFRDHLLVWSLPETIFFSGSGFSISQEQKVQIRKWLDETEGPGTVGKCDTGIAMRFVHYFRAGRVWSGGLFLVLSEYIFDEDWSAISNLLSADQIHEFRQYLQRKSEPDSQEAVDSGELLCSPEKKERIRQWLQEN